MVRTIKHAIVFLPQFSHHLGAVLVLKIGYYGRIQDPSGVARICSWALDAFQPSCGWAWQLARSISCFCIEKSKSTLASVFFLSLLHVSWFCVWNYISPSQQLYFLPAFYSVGRKEICATTVLLEYGIQLQRWMVLHSGEIEHTSVSIYIKKLWLFLNLPPAICALYLYRLAKIPSKLLLLEVPTPNMFNMNHLYTFWLRC